MTIDLEQELARVAGSVHDDAAVERMSGQVRTMVGRIKRRRAARRAATGVVGVGAVAAVAVAGVQLADGRNTPPPADAGPGPDLLAPPLDACGLTLGQLGWTGVGPVSLEPYEGPPTGRADGGVSLSTQVVKHADVELRLDATAPHFVAVDPETGVVTGVPDAWRATEPDWAAAGEQFGADDETLQSFVMSVSTPLRDCTADVDAPGREAYLAPGTYDIHGVQVVHPQDTYEGMDTFVAVGGPWPIDVTGAEDDGATPGAAMPPAGPTPELTPEQAQAKVQIEAWLAAPVANRDQVFPRCGAQAVLDDGSTPLVLDPPFEGQGTEVDEDGTFQTTITMRTRDGQYVIGNAAGTGATLVLMKDGVVVGYQWLDSEDLTLVDLQPDQTLEIPLRGNRMLCGTGEGGTGPALPLPRDTYQAVAVVDVMLKEVGTPGGSAESVTRTVPVMSSPVDVTIR